MGKMESVKLIDTRGAACASITYLSEAYRHSKYGDILDVLFTEKVMKEDTKKWAAKTKNEIIEIKEGQGETTARIRINKR
jgi:TusA-related sulfurtransferase